MKGIPVTMCCHSTKSGPKFSAEIGDTVLVTTSEGLLQELTIQALGELHLQCLDVRGALVEISPSEIKAVYME